MLDTLYSQTAVLDRFRAAPLVEERTRYLQLCADRGHNRAGLRKISWLLLLIVTHVPLAKKIIDMPTITRAAERHKRRFKRASRSRLCSSSQRIFIGTAKRFFQFIGRLAPPVGRDAPCESDVSAYLHFMREERGLSATTIEARGQHISHLLRSIRPRPRSLRAITVNHVDRHLIAQSRKDKSWSRASIATLASSLRGFFRFAETQHWCRPEMAAAIGSPRMYTYEGLPRSPTWDQVQQLLAHATGDEPAQIRDLAVLLLLAVYGLRRSEVAGLRLDDIDWQAETVRIHRSKQRRTQHFPLVRPVAEAIVRYLREVRPRCPHREVFLALRPPMRPLSASSISAIVRWRLRALGVTLPRVGAHCLRHACARHLLARGFSLKEIGDQLGHRRASATLLYAKVDLDGLRQVAEFDLGRLV
jgi:site-specific recombinase XerD